MRCSNSSLIILLVQAAREDVPSPPLRKGRSESWLDVAQHLVCEETFSGYEAEQAVLTEALHATTGVECRRIGRTDLDSARLLTDRWAVIIPGESDDPAPAALIEFLSPENVSRLALPHLRRFQIERTYSPPKQPQARYISNVASIRRSVAGDCIRAWY